LFRIPATAVLGAGLLAVAATPLALSAPGLQAIYLVPVALAVWVLRTRTTVDQDGIAVRTMFGRRAIPWEAVRSLRLDPRSRVRAVLADETEVVLPAVRTRHLPVLAVVSGGRLADPTATGKPDQEAAADDQDEGR
jgi:hypothetical protein